MKLGELLPDVVLEGASGPVRLRDRLGKSLVLYFYTADDTLACTIMACALRDRYEDFGAAGATVLGVSPDDAGSHARFAAAHSLPFELLTDPGGEIAHAWGLRSFFAIGGRAAFVFDRAGVLHDRFASVLRFRRTIDRALGAVGELARRERP